MAGKLINHADMTVDRNYMKTTVEFLVCLFVVNIN